MTSTAAYFKNGIGNWVLMTPALQALASQEPDGKIDVVIDSDWEDSRTAAVVDLITTSPFVRRLIRHPSDSLNPRKYERWFYSRHSEGSAALQLFQAKNPLIGHKVNWRKSLMHEVDYYMNIVRNCFGYTGTTPPQTVSDTALPRNVEDVMYSRHLWVAVCNGGFAKMRGPKCWPHYNALANALRLRYDASIVGIGAPGELRGVRLDLDLTGALSITQTAGVLRRMVNLLVTTDTGLMHVADAIGVDQVVLFGGSLVSKNGPVNHARLVRANLDCVPCQYVGDFEKCKDPRCMKQLSVGQVMTAVGRYL